MSGLKFSNAVKQVLEDDTKELEKLAQKALKDTANDIHKKMTEFINTYFYEAYDPVYYERTYALLNSVTQTKMTKVGNSYQITIFLDPSKAGDYDNSGKERFYYNDFGQRVRPTDYNQNYDANNVFDLASQGIHGLPARGNSGWKNNSFDKIKRNVKSNVNFADMINAEMFYSDLLTKYSNMLRSNGFQVKIK